MFDKPCFSVKKKKKVSILTKEYCTFILLILKKKTWKRHFVMDIKIELFKLGTKVELSK